MGHPLRRRLAAALLAALTALPLAPAPASAARPAYHVVRPGQTIQSIARAHHIGWKVIAVWNGLRKPYTVHADDVLRLHRRPGGPLPAFRTWQEPVTPQSIGWNPALRCPVGWTQLRRIWVYYLDFAGNPRVGNLIMHRLQVVPTQRAFRALYGRRFRIQAMAPIAVNLPGAVGTSMMTSGWECRRVAGSNVWSQHAYGVAIDLNPVQNPMLKNGRIDPPAGAGHLRRGRYGIGMVHAAGAVPVFTANGFFWGGRWRTMKDWMHFSTTDR